LGPQIKVYLRNCGGGSVLGFRFNRKSLMGVVVNAGLAGIFSYFLRGDQIRSVIPWLFLLLVIPITHLCGRLSAVSGATLATLIFAFFLFPPLGTLVVHDTGDRITLISFQVGAIVVAYLCSPGLSVRRQAKNRL
jgi:K+-sensing histidine kinase KdpD